MLLVFEIEINYFKNFEANLKPKYGDIQHFNN